MSDIRSFFKKGPAPAPKATPPPPQKSGGTGQRSGEKKDTPVKETKAEEKAPKGKHAILCGTIDMVELVPFYPFFFNSSLFIHGIQRRLRGTRAQSPPSRRPGRRREGMHLDKKVHFLY